MDYVEPICALVDPAGGPGFVALVDRAAGPGGAGGRGGDWGGSECPGLGQVVTGVAVETFSQISGGQYKAFVSDLSVKCRRLAPPGDRDDRDRTVRRGSGVDGGTYGWVGVFSCPQGQWATGLHGAAGRYVDSLGLICGEALQPPPAAVELRQIDPEILQQGSGGLFEKSFNPNVLGGN
jgi:hypothetical protein